MKTLKTLFLFLALVCAGNSFGQTKEETIEWLKEKLVKHSKESTVEVLEISPCKVYLKRVYSDSEYEFISFNPSATDWRVVDWGSSGKTLSAVSGQIIEYKGVNKGKEHTLFSGGYKLAENGTTDIYERVAKALNHLATFCEMKKETF